MLHMQQTAAFQHSPRLHKPLLCHVACLVGSAQNMRDPPRDGLIAAHEQLVRRDVAPTRSDDQRGVIVRAIVQWTALHRLLTSVHRHAP
jgi:hypothetical protein